MRQQEDTFAVPNTFVILLSLIDAGADLYIKDNDGKTAYDLAAEAGVGVTHNPYGYKTIIEAYQNEKAKRPYITPIAFTMTNMLRMLNCVVADTYAYGTTYNDQTAYNRARLGDATGEVVVSTYTGWNNDYANFVYSTNSWFLRSGDQSSGLLTGVFCFSSRDGNGSNYSTRAIIAVFK